MDSDLNGASPQFTLTCISTGGPATTVTWTRDSTTVTEGTTETVLNDPVTAQYTHTLTVTGGDFGVYACTVTNNISSATATFTKPGILRVLMYTLLSINYVLQGFPSPLLHLCQSWLELPSTSHALSLLVFSNK